MLVQLLALQTALAYPDQPANQTADDSNDITTQADVPPSTISTPSTDSYIFSIKENVVDKRKKCNELHGEWFSGVKLCKVDHYRQKQNQQNLEAFTVQPKIEDDPQVEEFEEDQMYYPMRTPNDRGFSQQWGPQEIDGPEAWNLHIGEGRSDIVVAVIDTGVDYNHPDLQDQMWVDPTGTDNHGFDYRNNDNDPMDDDGHGTHCAGIIAASGDNNIGVAGMIWKGVKIMALKFLGRFGGRGLDGIRSVEYAIERGVTISSNSYGSSGGRESPALRRVLEAGRQRNSHKFFVAAGNDGSDNGDTPTWPCNMAGTMEDTVICVASTDENKRLSSFSNFNDNLVSIACPGRNIMSTHLGQRYVALSGTSMATPMCAGTFTLAASYNPAETLDVIREKMMETADESSTLQGRVISGGQANAFELLQAVGSGDGTRPRPTTTARPRPTTTARPRPTTSLPPFLPSTLPPFLPSSLPATPRPTTTARPRPTTTARPRPTTTARPRPTTTAPGKPKPTTTTERPGDCKDSWNSFWCGIFTRNKSTCRRVKFVRQICAKSCGCPKSSAQDGKYGFRGAGL